MLSSRTAVHKSQRQKRPTCVTDLEVLQTLVERNTNFLRGCQRSLIVYIFHGTSILLGTHIPDLGEHVHEWTIVRGTTSIKDVQANCVEDCVTILTRVYVTILAHLTFVKRRSVYVRIVTSYQILCVLTSI